MVGGNVLRLREAHGWTRAECVLRLQIIDPNMTAHRLTAMELGRRDDFTMGELFTFMLGFNVPPYELGLYFGKRGVR
jgi:hypothetical protein